MKLCSKTVFVALMVICSAVLPISALAASQSDNPQDDFLPFWKEPNLQSSSYIKGPVKEMKEEMAPFTMGFSMTGIEWKEEAKRLSSIERFHENGICIEHESYDFITGQLEEKTVVTLDSIPRSKEENVYGAQGQLLKKIELVFGSDGYLSEEVVTDSNGTLLERWIYTRGGTQNEINVFNGAGILITRQVIYPDRKQVDDYEYDELGNLESKAVSTDTGLTTETLFYDKTLKFVGRTVSTYEEPGKILTNDRYDENNVLVEKNRYVYEGVDAYGNWLKRTLYFEIMADLDEEGGDDFPLDMSEMPSMAEYHTFTYHTQTGVDCFILY